MKASRIPEELWYPLVNPTVAIAILVFSVILWLTVQVMQLGPVLAIAALAAMLVVIAALFRYGIGVLEARATGRNPDVADIDIFSPFGNLWSLFAIVLPITAAFLLTYADSPAGTVVAVAGLVLFCLVYPASVAVLAITHSPLESLNPMALMRMITACGPSYVVVLVLVAGVSAASWLLASSGLPVFLVILSRVYLLFLLFTLTGAAVFGAGVAGDLDIGASAGPGASEAGDAASAARTKALNHAYGFISRGNREGGLKHVRDFVAQDTDPDDAIAWFFNAMMKWESKDAALFFAQDAFSHYLHHDMHAEALKLMSTCVHSDPRWRPKREDVGHAVELAERFGRDDLLRSLRG